MTLTRLPRSASSWACCPQTRSSACRSRSLSTATGTRMLLLHQSDQSITATSMTAASWSNGSKSTGARVRAATSSSFPASSSCSAYRSSGVVGGGGGGSAAARSLCTLPTTRMSAQACWHYPNQHDRRRVALSGASSSLGQARISTLQYPTSSSTSRSFPQLVRQQQQQQQTQQQCRRCYSQLTAAIESMPAGNSSGSSSRSMMGAASVSSATKSAASGLHSTAFPIQATTGSVGRMAPTMAFTPATSSPRRRYSPQHFYQNRILDPYVHQTVTPITLRQLVFFGRNMQPDKLLKSANYVRTELPVRLAHRIRDFQNLPFIVGTNPHIELVYDLYWQAFEKLRKVPEIKTLDDNEKFCELVKGLLNDHLVVIPQLALGIMECSKHIPPEVVDQFMNKMLRSRISRRVLAEQHISLTANYNSPNHMMTDRGYIGIIYTHCNPRDIVERTALLAAETCRQAIGGGIEPPKVVLDGNIDAEFSYIPDHIEYILYELLKNSMRFVMLRNNELNSQQQQPGGELPPIQITVCEGTHDIVFRISDRGGGIDPETEKYLWSYAQQSARFANFEKVSRMAATVQEQLVSPSRGTSSPQDVEEEEEDEEDIAYKSGVAATAADNDDSSHDDDESVVLPPPPKPVASRRDAKSGSKDKVTPVIQLDRHAREQYRLKKQHQHQQQQQQHSTGAAAASPTPQMIDPSQQRGQPVAKKVGHLDPRQQQDTAVHLGIGLPMSKVYAEYWGGDLKVFTMHGYGTDAYAKFCKFGNIYENFNV